MINEEAREVDADVSGGQVRVTKDALREALEWELKPEGLCQGDVCVPFSSDGDTVDLRAVARALGRPVVEDDRVFAMALPAEERRRGLDALVAPDFTLPDLDGNTYGLADWGGRKKLLLAFSTW